MRRLSHVEYDNTLRDLLGISAGLSKAFATDVEANGSGYVRGGAVSTVDADQLREAAELVGRDAAARLSTLLPCSSVPAARSDEDNCARSFIDNLARRAYRRPVAGDEAQSLFDYYVKVRSELGYGLADAVRLVVQVIVQSPNFLYRWELGNRPATREGSVIKLNDHEMAARLSYALWASMPDDELFAAADAGSLQTPEAVAAQARRLLASEKARDMFSDFDAQWLGLGNLANVTKDTAIYTGFTPALALSMERERQDFLAFVLGPGGDGRLETLLTAPFSFLDSDLATLYGVDANSGDASRRFMLDPSQRAGILTQAAFLTVHAAPSGSHPIQRGKQILLRLLCTELPPAPPNIPPLPAAGSGLTTRERFAQHGESACAQGCHEQMDPLGFAFENYDGIGAFRASELGRPVDASGVVTLDGEPRSFTNAVELSALLAASDTVRSCVSRQLFRYAVRRRETANDDVSLSAVYATFAASGYDLREALIALASTRSFAYRMPAAGEVLQ